MSAGAVPRIRAVGTIEDHRVSYDSSSGEICPNCEVMHRDVESLEVDIRLKNRKIKELESNRERLAQNSEWWPVAQQLFAHWQSVTGRRKSPWSEKRFWEIEPHLRHKKFGPRLCQRAIDGAAFQSWVSQRSNGTLKWHTDWQKIFESPGTVEEMCNRAPRGWTVAYSVEMCSWPRPLLKPEHAGGWFGIRAPKGWKPPGAETATGQTALIGVVQND